MKKQLNNGKAIALVLLISTTISCCQNPASKVASRIPNISQGDSIFRTNCSGCHSFKDDTTYAKLGLYDLARIDSNELTKDLYKVLKDSIHRQKITMKDSFDVESVKRFIRDYYKPKF